MTTTSNHHFSCPNHLSSSSYDLIRSVYSIASRTLVQHVVPRERKRGDDGGAGRRRPTRRVCFDSLFQLLARTTLGYQTFFLSSGSVCVCACSSLHVSTCSTGSRSLQRMPIRGEGWLRVPWKGGTHRRPVFVFFLVFFFVFLGGSRGEWGTVAMYRVPRGCFFLFFFCSR